MGNWVPGSSGGFVNAKQSHWVIPGYDGVFFWHPLYDPSPDVYIQKAAWAEADFFEPTIGLGKRLAIPVFRATGDVLTPVILVGAMVGPIGLAPVSSAKVFPPTIKLTQKIGAKLSGASARMYVPSLKIGWDIVPSTPFRASGAVLTPVVKWDSTQVVPLLSSTGQVFAPVVRLDKSVTPPRLVATGGLLVPVVNAVNFNPVTTSYLPATAQTGATYTYTIPNGARNLDIICVGGGGGSYGSGFGATSGAVAGTFAGATVDISTLSGATTLAVTAGAGGVFGAGNGGSGGAGAASTVKNGATTLVSGAGAPAGSSSGRSQGLGSGNFTFNGIAYVGSANTAGGNQNGNTPGGGGGGRNEAFSGGYSGGDGGVWIRAY